MITRSQLEMLGNKAFALYLLEVADGPDSNVYKIGSSIFAGDEPNPERVGLAIKELGNNNFAYELEARFGKRNAMTEIKMAEWVQKNCKFAAKKEAGILDFLGPQATQSKNPHQIFQHLMQAYKSRASMGPTTPQEIQGDLAQVDQQMFGGQAVLNTPENIQALMKAATPAQPAAAPAKPSRFIPDPVDQYMNQPHLPKPSAKGL